MQEFFNKIINFEIPLNEYLIYGILAFFVLFTLICLLIIYTPHQKMPKMATVATNSCENKNVITEKKRKKDKKQFLPQKKENNVELNVATTQTAPETKSTPVVTEDIFRVINDDQTLQGPEGTKVINLADYAVSYTPDLSQPEDEQSEIERRVVLDGQLSLEDKVTGEETEENEATIVTENGKNFEIVMKRSFQAKLIQSVDEIKEFYAEVADYIVSFGLKNRFAWSSSMFLKDKKTLAKIAIRGKTLCLYLALLPKLFVDTKYRAKDVSATKKFESTPLMVKVKSERGVKYAKELIDEMMKSFGISANMSFIPSITAKMYPFDTTDSLIEQGLIKLVKTEVKPFPQNQQKTT